MILIETMLFVYFAIGVLYISVLSVSGRFLQPKTFPKSTHLNKICILVPCYKEDQIMISVVEQLLSTIKYPKEYFDIVIIADSFQEETLNKLSSYPIILINAKLEQSSKANSINYALERLDNSYQIALISDADNIPERNFLHKVNDAYSAGHSVIQAQRVAKNLNTPFAILDGISEMINNHLFRKGSNSIGLSASIIGSGMAMNFDLYKEQMSKIHTVDEDRPLQLSLFEAGYKIIYLEGALIFDEKVAHSDAFQKQRGRWLASQWYYTKKFFFKGVRLLLKGNVDYFNHAVIHNVIPPRALMLFGIFVIAFVISLLNFQLSLRWWLLLFVYVSSLLIALPAKIFGKEFFKAILYIPQAIFKIILSLFYRKKTQQDNNIHTAHTHINIENHLFKQNDNS